MDISEIHEIKDEKLISATLESWQTGKLTPLLKEELKCRILTKCLEEGKELQMDCDPKTTPVKRKLLPEELEKLERRREQNRRAAKKFRQKKRTATGMLSQIVTELENKNKELRDEIKRLLSEMSILKTYVANHLCSLASPECDAETRASHVMAQDNT